MRTTSYSGIQIGSRTQRYLQYHQSLLFVHGHSPTIQAYCIEQRKLCNERHEPSMMICEIQRTLDDSAPKRDKEISGYCAPILTRGNSNENPDEDTE
jgi:hypothetical protein